MMAKRTMTMSPRACFSRWSLGSAPARRRPVLWLRRAVGGDVQQRDRIERQTTAKIVSKPPALDITWQVSAGRRHHANVRASGPQLAHALVSPLLQDA